MIEPWVSRRRMCGRRVRARSSTRSCASELARCGLWSGDLVGAELRGSGAASVGWVVSSRDGDAVAASPVHTWEETV